MIILRIKKEKRVERKEGREREREGEKKEREKESKEKGNEEGKKKPKEKKICICTKLLSKGLLLRINLTFCSSIILEIFFNSSILFFKVYLK